MKKTYVLDTNVLLSNPEALFSFDEHDVVIPEAVLEELDNKKTGNKQININAREVARKLYALKNSFENEHRTLFDGVALANGGTLYVELANKIKKELELPHSWDVSKRDNDILLTCLSLKEQSDQPVILVTKDTFLGIKADSLGIANEDYRTDAVVSLSEQYKGHLDLTLTNKDFREYIDKGFIYLDHAYEIISTDDSYEENYEYESFPNEFVTLHNAENYLKQTALGKISSNGEYIEKLYYENQHPFGVTPRNAEQKFMQEALMLPVDKAPLVIIKGPAGSAKTFYSLACGLENVMEDRNYRKILVCRPNQTMEEDLGFLPGTEKEKIGPLMRPIYDNLETLVDSDYESRVSNEEELQDKVNEIFERGVVDTQSVGYLRGRSIENQWIILDEAQNLSANQAKAIVTRAGKNTKVIFCGDPRQIDNQFVNEKTNGLSYLAEKMKESGLQYVITTDESDIVRSDLAKEAVKFLEEKSEEEEF